jgi:hypothetical protein
LYFLSLLYVCGWNAGVGDKGWWGRELFGVFVCVFPALAFCPFLSFSSIPKLYSRGSKIRGVWVGGWGWVVVIPLLISLSFIICLDNGAISLAH